MEKQKNNCSSDLSKMKITRLLKRKLLKEAQADELMKVRAGASSLSTGPNTVNSSGNCDAGLASGSQGSAKPTDGKGNKRKMPMQKLVQADELMKARSAEASSASTSSTRPNTVNSSCNIGLVSGSQDSLKPPGGMGNKKKTLKLKQLAQAGEGDLMIAGAGTSGLSTGPNTGNSSCICNCHAGLASGSQGISKPTVGVGNKIKMPMKKIAQDDELMKAKAAEASSASVSPNTVNSSCNTGVVSGSQGYSNSKPTGAGGVGNKRKMPLTEIAQADEPMKARVEASSASTRPNTVNSGFNTGLVSGSQCSLKPTGGMGNKRELTVDDEDEWERNDEVYKKRVCQFWCRLTPQEFRRMQKEIIALKTGDDEYQITKRLPYSFTLFMTAMNIQ